METEIKITNAFEYNIVNTKMATESNDKTLNVFEIKKDIIERRSWLLKSIYGIRYNNQINNYCNYSGNNINISITLNKSLVRTNYYYFC